MGGEGQAVLVKVKGATLDVRDESEGNAVQGIFAVDPLLSLLVTTDQTVDAVIKERMVSEQVTVGDTVEEESEICRKMGDTVFFWKRLGRMRCCQ